MRAVAPLLLLLFIASGGGLTPEASAQAPGNCSWGSAEADLGVSNVFARVFNTGSLFFGGTTTNGNGYLVPKSSGESPIFAAGLWLGGTVNGEVRAAGARYTNFTFWPGPLEGGAALPNSTDCSAFDRIYVVSRVDVANYERGFGAASDLRDWPVGLGAPSVDASGRPVLVLSRDQRLDLAAGERPALSGLETAFWVMNDVGGQHSALNTQPLGVEVRVTAFLTSDSEVPGSREASFYRYEIVNRSPDVISNMRAGLFVDIDLGGATDDYVGTDVDRGMLFGYNGQDFDASYGTPPAIGIDLFSGAGATSAFATGGAPGTGDPSRGVEIYNYLQGLWADGTSVRANGNGYGQPPTFPATPYQFPGDPVSGEYWSEVNADGEGLSLSPGDRRGSISTPAFDLAPGESYLLDIGILFAQGSDRFDSITDLRAVSDAAQEAYDSASLFLPESAPPPITLAAPVLSSPNDGEDLTSQTDVTFSWDPVIGAAGYEVSWGSDGEAAYATERTSGTSIELSARQLAGQSGVQPVYWTVRALSSSGVSESAPVQEFSVFRGGVLRLQDGSPAYTEVARGDSMDPCGPNASSTDGCAEGYGNPIYRSLNSTGAFYFSEAMGTNTGSEPNLDDYSPRDYEIRFVESGSLGGYLFQSPYNVIRVPFEVWDIGTVGAGEANDTSDDIQLIPMLFADDGGTCLFNADEIPSGSATMSEFVESDRIYAYYPATSYAAFEAAFASSVDTASGGCYRSNSSNTLLNFTTGTRPIQRQVFGSPATAPALPPTGTVIRMYTADPPGLGTAEEGTPEAAGALALSVGPNPVQGAATVRLRLNAPKALVVRVVDVLGREVAVLADGRFAADEHTFALPAGLASGVYAVEASAGERRATRLVTVVR